MSAFKDRAGERFGRLLILRRAENGKGRLMWECKCDCGNLKTIAGRHIVSGATKSCGCISVEKSKARKNNYIHGNTGHLLHKVWVGLRRRCCNPKDKDFARYGGRGICVCKEWLRDFMSFYEFSIQAGWMPGLQIDRKDNSGPYSPSNCRFVPAKVNTRNTRVSKKWVVEGVVYPSMNCAARAYSVSSMTIRRWCDGYILRGKHYRPRGNCWSYRKYADVLVAQS